MIVGDEPMTAGFFVEKEFHYKKTVVHYKSVNYVLQQTDIIMIRGNVPVKGFYV